MEEIGAVQVYTANGSKHDYRVFGITELEEQGRKCQVRAVELPRDSEPLLPLC